MLFVDYRVFYTKTGRLKYISHLDVNRLMQRALKRSLLPVWYSEGFNPHIYLTFALPLALGVESRFEVMDFRLTASLPEKEIARRLQAALPPGMEVLRVARPVCKPQEIGFARFAIRLSGEDPALLLERWNGFLGQESIPVEKKTKRGVKRFDLRPEIRVASCEAGEEALTLELLLPAGIENNVSPFLVLEAFSKCSGLSGLRTELCKTEVLCKNGEIFA